MTIEAVTSDFELSGKTQLGKALVHGIHRKYGKKVMKRIVFGDFRVFRGQTGLQV